MSMTAPPRDVFTHTPRAVVTVLEELDGRAINKQIQRASNGGVVKAMAKNSGTFAAQTIEAPDLDSFAAILDDLGMCSHKTLMLGAFIGAPAEPFLVVPRDALARSLDIEPTNQDLLGFHEINGAPHVARLKQNCAFSAWLLLDRDGVEGMPDVLADLSPEAWVDAMEALLPGFKAAGRVVLPSTSRRVVVNGLPLESRSYHTFVQVSDPSDIPRVWGQLLPKAFITPLPDQPSWEDQQMLGFMRPKFSRTDRSMIVAHAPWSIFDPSTGQANRLVFDGAPTVQGADLSILPPQIEVHDGPPLDLSLFADLTAGQLGTLEKSASITVQRERAGSGSHARITGITTTAATLTHDLELDTPAGWTTVRQLAESGAGHTRCQSPFRESSSWAAFYSTHEDGSPFVFDSGTATKYTLADDLRGDALFDLSHDGLALHLGKRWARHARHVALWGRWLFWAGDRWAPDEMLDHMTRCRSYLRDRADRLVRRAQAGDAPIDLETAEKAAKGLRALPLIAAVASLARSNPELASTVGQWNREPLLLGTPKGDLK